MIQFHPLSKSIALALSTLLTVTALSGCGSDDDRKTPTTQPGHDHDHDDDHDHDHDEESEVTAELKQGRILITEKDSNKAYVYSLAQNKVIQNLDLTGQADALQTSPDGNYVIVLDRTNQGVNFYHSGLEIEDHGDHDHPYARDVTKMPLQLNYARPVHYQTYGEQAGLFFDGLGAAGNPIENPAQAAGFALVTDTDIASGKLPYQKLNTNMHGTAEPRGNYVISTGRYDTVGSPLADTISVFERHSDHYHLNQTFDTKCQGLHGSGSVIDFSVFACSDGILSVKQVGDAFSTEKITYPVSLTNSQCANEDGSSSPARIGSFATNHHHNYLVGTACGQPYRIDPVSKNIAPIVWTTNNSRRVVSYDFDAHGEHLMLLDDAGTLHLLDVTQNYKQVAALSVIPNGIKNYSHGGPSLIVNPNTEMVYVMDSENKQIVKINPGAKKIESKMKLSFAPSQLAWFGVKTEHSDEHHHES